jgi:hypothetical protein
MSLEPAVNRTLLASGVSGRRVSNVGHQCSDEGETRLQHEQSRKRKRDEEDERDDRSREWILKNTKVCEK